MNQPQAANEADPPLVSVYAFNEPGQAILLFDGGIGGLLDTDVPGVVELRCASDLALEWEIRRDPADFLGFDSEVALVLRRPSGDALLPAGRRDSDGGWTNGAAIGNPDAPLGRIIAHWFNLPDLHGPLDLMTNTVSGEHRWKGRWESDIDGWQITLDVRPDHERVWQGLHKARVYVMTHAMEIRRADGATFTAADAEPVLTALHVGVSFALGRWAAPVLPVGLDTNGDVVWEDWRAPHCDPARSVYDGWWHERRHGSLAEFLTCVVEAFADPDRLPALRLQMMLSIVATADKGFVEQRIMAGGTALEHAMWQILVLGGQMTADQYGPPAHRLLRRVLTAAAISTDIDPQILPVMAKFATDEAARQGRTLDGPDVVTQVRNRLVHPKGGQEQIYRLDGLLTEVWALTRHYSVLLILHSIGYNGSYRDLRRIQGSVWDVGTVPWR